MYRLRYSITVFLNVRISVERVDEVGLGHDLADSRARFPESREVTNPFMGSVGTKTYTISRMIAFHNLLVSSVNGLASG